MSFTRVNAPNTVGPTMQVLRGRDGLNGIDRIIPTNNDVYDLVPPVVPNVIGQLILVNNLAGARVQGALRPHGELLRIDSIDPYRVFSIGNLAIKGDKGDDGETKTTTITQIEWSDPPAGEKGATGATGPRGFNGTGLKGDPGAQGATGLRGNLGPTGEKGATGDTGPRGYRGQRGLGIAWIDTLFQVTKEYVIPSIWKEGTNELDWDNWSRNLNTVKLNGIYRYMWCWRRIHYTNGKTNDKPVLTNDVDRTVAHVYLIAIYPFENSITLDIFAVYDTHQQFLDEHPEPGRHGEAVLILNKDKDPPDDIATVYIWDEAHLKWSGPFPFQGPQGPDGLRGRRGPRGFRGIDGVDGSKGSLWRPVTSGVATLMFHLENGEITMSGQAPLPDVTFRLDPITSDLFVTIANNEFPIEFRLDDKGGMFVNVTGYQGSNIATIDLEIDDWIINVSPQPNLPVGNLIMQQGDIARVVSLNPLVLDSHISLKGTCDCITIPGGSTQGTIFRLDPSGNIYTSNIPPHITFIINTNGDISVLISGNTHNITFRLDSDGNLYVTSE